MSYSKSFTLKWADIDDEAILNAVMDEVDELLNLDDFFPRRRSRGDGDS